MGQPVRRIRARGSGRGLRPRYSCRVPVALPAVASRRCRVRRVRVLQGVPRPDLRELAADPSRQDRPGRPEEPPGASGGLDPALRAPQVREEGRPLYPWRPVEAALHQREVAGLPGAVGLRVPEVGGLQRRSRGHGRLAEVLRVLPRGRLRRREAHVGRVRHRCEACHGPGERHVKAKPAERAGTIVNPASLPFDYAASTCGQCHTRGKSPDGKWDHPIGFRVGDYLTTAHYAVVDKKNEAAWWPDGSVKQHRQQYPQWKDSRHAKAGVTCITCHSVHEATSKFGTRTSPNNLCLSCHSTVSTDSVTGHAPIAGAPQHSDCVGCHMARSGKSADRGDERVHTFRVVKPEVTVKLGDGEVAKQPNSCNGCHWHAQDPPANLQKARRRLYRTSGFLRGLSSDADAIRLLEAVAALHRRHLHPMPLRARPRRRDQGPSQRNPLSLGHPDRRQVRHHSESRGLERDVCTVPPVIAPPGGDRGATHRPRPPSGPRHLVCSVSRGAGVRLAVWFIRRVRQSRPAVAAMLASVRCPAGQEVQRARGCRNTVHRTISESERGFRRCSPGRVSHPGNGS
jgi:predicted CXXCH cytochrome family protein